MKKRILTVASLSALAILALSSLASCGEHKDIIGVSLPNQSTSLNVGIGNKVSEAFPDCEVKVQSADDSSTSQKQQVEAFITMGVKMIVLAPVEIKTIEETLIKARNAGIKVVVSGASDISDNCYDAVTVSNEFLVGNDVALLAKHWAEETYSSSSDFDTLILESTLGADPIVRSNGMKSISDPYLKNSSGDYVDASGAKVDEAKRVSNPCYSELVAGTHIYNVQMGTDSDGKTLVSTALLEHPNIRLVLMYGSLFAAGGSQYIVDTFPNKLADYGIFGGGVSGNEAAYLLGSMKSGVGQSVTVGGTAYTGLASVFRGAVSFGGEDAAKTVADLAEKVYTGTAGVDYEAKTPETIGCWYAYEDDEKSALACSTFNVETVKDFDPKTELTSANTVIKWSSAAQ